MYIRNTVLGSLHCPKEHTHIHYSKADTHENTKCSPQKRMSPFCLQHVCAYRIPFNRISQKYLQQRTHTALC